MNSEDILRLSRSCMHVLQHGACDPTFEADLLRYADILLSRSSESDSIVIDENYEALILYLSKLVVTSHQIFSPSIQVQLFRALTAFLLHFYGANRGDFTRFMGEWPQGFASNYLHCIFSVFLPGYRPSFGRTDLPNLFILQAAGTLLLLIYFSDDPTRNPFLKTIAALSSEVLPDLFDSIQNSLSSNFSVVLMYTLMVFCPDFRTFICSSLGLAWLMVIAEQLPTAKSSECELRLNIFLNLTEDRVFLKALALSGSGKPFVRTLLNFLKQKTADESFHQAFVTTITVLINFGENAKTTFDSSVTEIIWGLVKWFAKLANSAARFAEYARLLLLLAESLVVHHPKPNLPMIYSTLRHGQFLADLDKLSENSENPAEFAGSVHNLKVLVELLTTRVVAVVEQPQDADDIMRAIVPIVDGWDREGLFQVREYPHFTYQCNEFGRSVKFFRVMILKDIQEML
jgi:hypothetical protein